MVRSSDAEAPVFEASDQRPQTGRKRVKTEAQRKAHNDACRRSRKKIKLEKVKLRDENQNLKRELNAFKEQVEKREQMTRQILTSLEFNAQKISSLEHLQHLILSQPHDQQVCQGSAYTNITAPDARPSVPANPGYTTLLGAPTNNLFSPDPASGTPRNPGTGSSSAASHGISFLDDDPIVIEPYGSELLRLRVEELEKIEPELEQMQDENLRLILEMQGLKNEIMEKAAKQEQMMRQIFTMIRTPDGQTFSSPEECEAWFLSQNYAQQVQGSAFTNITASGAGPAFPAANPDLTTLLGALNNNLSPGDLAAGYITDHGMPVLDEKDVDQCISEMLGDPDSEKNNFPWQF